MIILDNVQCFPRAREMVKHLVADGRYDYIETGSLVSVMCDEAGILNPSEEETIGLHPLDFEEFLWATGDHASAQQLRIFFDERRPLGKAAHRRMVDMFRKYMLVGGMPQSVLAYLREGSFEDAERAKRSVLALFREDMSGIGGRQGSKVTSVFDSVPSQLSRREKRFRLASVGKGARTRQYGKAFRWLEDSGLMNRCLSASDPSTGLQIRDDFVQKCYMADTGLLVTHAIGTSAVTEESVYRSILLESAGINEGAFVENAVAQELAASGHRLSFYARNDRENRDDRMGIDFLIARDGKVCPVEVNSSRLTHSSLTKFMAMFGKEVGPPYVLCTKDLFEKDGILFLPVYMTMYL